MIVIGAVQERPPSVDRLTRSALRPLPPGRFAGGSMSSARLIWCAMPFGAKDSHGSVARCKVPPEHCVIPGTTTDCHVEPPSKLTPASSPRDPPSDQRSCCQNATMLLGFVGFTSTHGSTSLFRNTVRWPDGSRAIWPATSSAVHVANGLEPETCTSAPVTNGPARSATGASTIKVPMTTKGARLSLLCDPPVFMVSLLAVGGAVTHGHDSRRAPRASYRGRWATPKPFDHWLQHAPDVGGPTAAAHEGRRSAAVLACARNESSRPSRHDDSR